MENQASAKGGCKDSVQQILQGTLDELKALKTDLDDSKEELKEVKEKAAKQEIWNIFANTLEKFGALANKDRTAQNEEKCKEMEEEFSQFVANSEKSDSSAFDPVEFGTKLSSKAKEAGLNDVEVFSIMMNVAVKEWKKKEAEKTE